MNIGSRLSLHWTKECESHFSSALPTQSIDESNREVKRLYSPHMSRMSKKVPCSRMGEICLEIHAK